MTQIHDSVLNGMLKNITDPKLRETYGAILSGKFPYKVYCMDPQTLPGEKKPAHKAGVLIGYIDKKGKVITEPAQRKDGEIVSGVETSRDRFDGRKGFKCHCGNWSIQAPEEQPTFSKYKFPVPPTKQDLVDIHEALQKSGKRLGMDFVGGVMEYDGFRIEEVQS